MKQLIIKYSILLIFALILARLLTVATMTMWPDILTFNVAEGYTRTFSSHYLESVFEYLMNIAFIVLIAAEFKKQKVKSIPILIVTFFSSFVGVLFFLLFSANTKLISKSNNL